MAGILDIFGQQPFFTMSTQIYFAFSFDAASSPGPIIDSLADGLERLYAGFPWLACEVVNKGSGDGSSGCYMFQEVANAPRIIVKDMRQDTSMPTMDTLRRTNFPMHMLDEANIAPRKTFPGLATSNSGPVFLIQANLINGGLILTFAAQHNTMDMAGQAHIIRLFAKACGNESFTAEELALGNVSRQSIVPLLDDTYTPGPEIDRFIIGPRPPNRPPPAGSTWAYFTFSRTSLADLKSLASEADAPSSFISTDDALTAFIWRAITRARLPRNPASAESTIARAVNARPYLGISPLYPGPIQSSAYSSFTPSALVEEPLGNVAARLRRDIDPETSTFGFETRALATVLSRTPDKTTLSSTANFDLSIDLILSSWAKVGAYGLDFGLGLDTPVAVRRPQFQAVEGLVFLMPRTPDGEIAVAVSLRNEDMTRLRADAEFGSYAACVG